jgi:hypothetical protein
MLSWTLDLICNSIRKFPRAFDPREITYSVGIGYLGQHSV